MRGKIVIALCCLIALDVPAIAQNLSSQLSGRNVCGPVGSVLHFGAGGAYYATGIDRGRPFSRPGTWAANGNKVTLVFRDGDWRRDIVTVMPDGKTLLFKDDGGIFTDGKPRPKGGKAYDTFC